MDVTPQPIELTDDLLEYAKAVALKEAPKHCPSRLTRSTAAPSDLDEQPWADVVQEATLQLIRKPVVNSAGEDFQNLPERQKTVGTLTIQRNEAAYDDWVIEQYKNTTNANSITIGDTTYPSGRLLMQNISASGPYTATLPNEEDPEQPISVTYYQITYDIAKSANGFDLRLEDRGLNEISTETVTEDGNTYTITKLKPILGIDNQPVQTPYPLDGQGHAMPNATDPPAILVFRKYPSKDWSPLNLGESEED